MKFDTVRIKTAALRALRSGMRPALTAGELARFAECGEAEAGAALRVLQHEGALAVRGDGKRATYRLTPKGQEGAAV